MLHAVSLTVFPGPVASQRSQDKGHNNVDPRYQADQSQVGPVTQAPNPVDDKSSPVPPLYLRGQLPVLFPLYCGVLNHFNSSLHFEPGIVTLCITNVYSIN